MINGKVKNVSKTARYRMGRRKLVLRDTLEEWKRGNEESDDDVMIRVAKIDAVRRMEEDLYA